MSDEKALEEADRREWIRENMERVDPRVDALLGYSATEAIMQRRDETRSDMLALVVEAVLAQKTDLSRPARYVTSQAVIEALKPHILQIAKSVADRPTRWSAADWEAFDSKPRPE